MLDDIQKAFIKKHQKNRYTEEGLTQDLVADFVRLVKQGVYEGLHPAVSFETARNHFKLYGQAMVDFAGKVVLEDAGFGKPPWEGE